MKFTKSIRLFVLRNIRSEKFLTLLAVLGVALGVGLFVGVKAASDRAVSSFESDIRGLVPHASFEVVDRYGINFNEKIYKKIRGIDNRSYPVLQVDAYLPDLKQTINLNGIDVIRSAGFLESREASGVNMEAIFTTLNGVLISRGLADRFSLKRGDTLKALAYDGRYSLKVVNILDLKTLPADTVFMDLGNFQEYFHKTGLLSRIDISADRREAGEIGKILPHGLVIEKKTTIIENRKSLLRSFRYNLQFISLIAILVGIFLLYNTVFISVVKRRTEIGILRSLGMDKKTVIGIFIFQGLILGVAGSLLGIVLGQIAAYFAVTAVAKTVSTMYGAVSVADYLLSWKDAVTAVFIGTAVSLVASVVPAYESSTIRPNESSREGSFEGKYGRYMNHLFLAGLCLIAIGIIVSLIDYLYAPFNFPFLAYTGILLIIAGFASTAPLYLSFCMKVIRKPSSRFFGATGKLSAGDISGNIYRFAVALMSVAISSALIIAFLLLIFSFRSSLEEWIRRNIAADIYVKPAACMSNFCFYPLSNSLVNKVETSPGVAAVDKFRTLYINFRGKKVVAGFGDTEVQREYAHARDYGQRREAGISSYLGNKYHLKKGDTIELSTPKGDVSFRVRDVFSSYSTTSGFIYLDRRYLKEYWGLDDATQLGVYVKKGAGVRDVVRGMREELLPHYSVEIMDNVQLRDSVLSVFNKTFAITYAIELISIIVSIIGVITTLLTLVLEKKREISIIRYLGGSWKQIQRVLILSAGTIGLTGILLGMIMGPLMSLILIEVVNKISFGWEIHMRVPVLYLSAVIILLFLTTLAAGLLPARVAKKIDPKRFISFE
ncbi:MAG: FtsX-like permease family protein [Candidatus Sulfobium sp.]|jgi:putative ABC transport system permease protein